METTEKNQALLTSEETRIFLKPIETDLAYNADIRELQKIKGFLAKYHLPYMQYKLDTLSHLKDKLLVINSLESLMTLYKRLIMGIAFPLRHAAEQPGGEPVGIFETDAAGAEKTRLLAQEVPVRCIVQIDSEIVREHELHPAHRIVGAWKLPNPQFLPTSGDGLHRQRVLGQRHGVARKGRHHRGAQLDA